MVSNQFDSFIVGLCLPEYVFIRPQEFSKCVSEVLYSRFLDGHASEVPALTFWLDSSLRKVALRSIARETAVAAHKGSLGTRV
jgi:hypothetical protein